jgi:hypothetical protein
VFFLWVHSPHRSAKSTLKKVPAMRTMHSNGGKREEKGGEINSIKFTQQTSFNRRCKEKAHFFADH